MTALAVGIFAGFSALSIQQSRQSAHQQSKAIEAERRRAAAANIRARSKALADNRIQSAQVAALGENLGVGLSSAVQGAIGSASSTTFGNIGFQQQLENLDQKRLNALDKANSFKSNANTFGAFASVTATLGAHGKL